MVREHLGVILVTPELLDPFAGEAVLLGPSGAWNLAVRHVAHEQVSERVLALTRDRGTTLATDELLSLEPVQRGLGRGAVDTADLRRRAEPEHLPEHGGVLEERLLVFGQRVEPGGDDSLHRLGHRELAASGDELAVGHHPHELLRVQRVATCPLEQRSLRFGREHRPLEQGSEEARGLVVVER